MSKRENEHLSGKAPYQVGSNINKTAITKKKKKSLFFLFWCFLVFVFFSKKKTFHKKKTWKLSCT